MGYTNPRRQEMIEFMINNRFKMTSQELVNIAVEEYGYKYSTARTILTKLENQIKPKLTLRQELDKMEQEELERRLKQKQKKKREKIIIDDTFGRKCTQ